VSNERDYEGQALLHHAAEKRSVEFIKVLVETNGGLEVVRAVNRYGELPIHMICITCNVEAAKYLHSIYPESINIANHRGGLYPLHFAVWTTIGDPRDLIQFLLQHNQGAASKPTICGGLALHLACERCQSLEVVKLIYNAYPEAIHTRNNRDRSPLDICLYNGNARRFLSDQLEWERRARENTQPDEQGQLPIHILLQSPDVSVGTVQLMTSAHPESARARDNSGLNPLHYACKFGHVDVVKFLLDFDEESTKDVTLSGDLPLQFACREGKCGVVNFILEISGSSYGVASRNNYGKLPIELLLGADVNQNSLEFVDAMYRLLRAHPGVLECAVANGCDVNDDDRTKEASSCSLKRKRENI
jgi:ankyrin repeat protein